MAQDMVLFNDTIYYNILYGRLGATPEDVFAAARQAAVHDQVLPSRVVAAPTSHATWGLLCVRGLHPSQLIPAGQIVVG